MEETIPRTIPPAVGIRNQNHESTTDGISAHFQATISENATPGTENDVRKHLSLLKNGNVSLDSQTEPNHILKDTTPDQPSPHGTTRLFSALRKPGPAGSRASDPSSLEPTPPISRMNTVLEDEIEDVRGPGQKSVQFSQGTANTAEQENDQGTGTPTDGEQTKPQSLYSKLRALAASQGFAHTRSASGISVGGRSTDGKDQDDVSTPRPSRNELGLAATLEEDGSEVDADEESAAEGAFDQTIPRKRRRRGRRLDEIETAPASPHSPVGRNLVGTQSATSSRILPITRRVTDTDMATASKGLSEDEGRKQLKSANLWSPKHPLRGLSYGGQKKDGEATPERPEARRPLTLLNLTSITSHRGEGPDSGTQTPRPSRRRMLTERGTTLSAAKWKQIKNGLRLLGQRQKKERTQDHEKSAELLAELAAGSPAALMIASMFQRDEHGSRRIPVLLEQIKVSVTDSEMDKYKDPGNPTPGDRHMIFRIELEYGNGINRMRWVVRRSLRDFANLHLKYKLHYQSEKLRGRGDSAKEMPKFPKRAFPYLKNFRGLDDEEEEEDDPELDQEGARTDTERPGLGPRYRTRQSTGLIRRKSSFAGQGSQPATPGGTLLFGPRRDRERDVRFPERQRKKLEIYLQKMIKFLLFRADANRLCKFLEVSALGMRLASEGSYHGKEGFLMIRSAKGLDFRKSLTPANIKLRHAPKWFLVRHSYVVCVDSPEEMHIYDVFLFDSDFVIQSSRSKNQEHKGAKQIASAAKVFASNAKESAKHPQHHRLRLQNSERKLKLLARNERQLLQFEESIKTMVDGSAWAKVNRFESFAPVRTKCFAQWLVDGRDHMWVVSRALNQAKDVIYIHDWWLSPELYMRRPPAISQKWRLDRLLKRKAEQGVKIFVIVYRNIDAAVPIDSQYTKFSLLDLHPNIFVQRSPNQFRQNTFFWAHHEKICIVDHTLAFVGGIDLCFGRWDTPQHTLVDDKPTGFETSDVPKDADHCQLWPGKDYSNPRIQDFYALNKPYEEMYDRTQVARMPWHDISMQVIGQPARDLTRHFVQRWNYILRQRKPTRPTPFLLPPPDFNPADLEALGLDGTCEIQILRSAGPWSMGTPDKTEHSIMNAYIKMIEESDHFVYMENQFFISSCETDGTIVYNKIGDALVERIARAARNDEAWRAIIVIPLIPGFQNTVEQEGGTSVRLIMQYQFRSICRGESSIFGRLRALGIDPEDFIQFYSLRQWGRIGARKALTTEQLYIHAKCMVVDDRVAIIGSANVNERSMLGNRDSECAAVVRDTDMFWSQMNGQPYRVGRFAHTLRMRLMREHLGLDVDTIMEDAQAVEADHKKHEEQNSKNGNAGPQSKLNLKNMEKSDDPLDIRGRELQDELLARHEELSSFNHDVDWEQAGNPNLKSNRKLTEDSRVTGTESHKKDIDGEGIDNMAKIEEQGFGNARDTVVLKDGKELLVSDLDAEGKTTLEAPRRQGDMARLTSYVVKREMPNPPLPPKPPMPRMNTEQLGLPMVSQLPALPNLDDTDIGGPMLERTPEKGSGTQRHHLFSELHHPLIDRDCMLDPVHDAFSDGIWHTIAENNTKIYRAVFRCMPDNQVKDWNDYHQYMAYEQRFNHLQGKETVQDDKVPHHADPHEAKRTGPPGAGTAAAQIKALSKVPTDLEKKTIDLKEKVMGAFGEGHNEETVNAEKDALRNWAAETNKAQMTRQGSDLGRKTSFPALDEKAALQSVPEDSQPRVERVSEESEIGKAVATSTETGQRKVTPTAQTSAFSDIVNSNIPAGQGSKRRRRGTTRSSRRDFSATDDIIGVGEAEELLGRVQGHLVEWPYDWLEKVEAGSNWLFPFDQISPIEIYI